MSGLSGDRELEAESADGAFAEGEVGGDEDCDGEERGEEDGGAEGEFAPVAGADEGGEGD